MVKKILLYICSIAIMVVGINVCGDTSLPIWKLALGVFLICIGHDVWSIADGKLKIFEDDTPVW